MSDTKRRDDEDEDAGEIKGPKKHHFTPLELQKKQLDKLLEKIDKPVLIPERSNQTRAPKEPRDYVKNVQGSSAGAGSGEFHVYRAMRRREYARLKNMELESKEEREQREHEEKINAMRAADEEKTEKNRNKRQKRKQRARNNSLSKKKNSSRSNEGNEDEESEGEHSQDDREDNKRSKRESDDEDK
ncbi:hypothetical protein BGX21_000997 [Mortierella sp. AD011]|nr:hypothetical protein BGX20_001086 [Mortierella sp. AD010]KAF9385670.1 hypothetical protein BGX21_000997 [Mortierella sp. AD011]